MKKIWETIVFYFKKIVKILDAFIDNFVKTIEVILSKIPAIIEDIYRILRDNTTIQNFVALMLTYLLFNNFSALSKIPVILISILVAILLIFDKIKLK